MTPSQPWRCPQLLEGRPVASIPARQAQVLTGLASGLTNAQIARRFGMSEDAVKTYSSRLYRALGARDRCHAVALAVSGQVIVHIKGES